MGNVNETQIKQQDNRKNKKVFLFEIIVVIAIVVAPILLYILDNKNSVNRQVKVPSSSITDNTCQGQKQKFQELLGPESVVDGITVGTLKGVISNVTYNSDSKTASLVLTPENGSNTYQLSLHDGNIRIANTISHKYEISLSALEDNQHVELSYNCDPENGNLFTIVSVSINQ